MSLAVNPQDSPEIGKYRLVATLARGGMGNVYLAASQGPGGFNKLLAVKELKPEMNEEEVYVAMFMEEARLAARLAHPNIVQTIEVASDHGRHYMVMEYLDGRSLHRIGKKMAGHPSFTVGVQLRILAEALLGLQYAHDLCDFNGEALNVVHRDMSPLNIFLTFDGQTKVIDFGIAKSEDSGVETKTGILKGRVAYMAPEQAWGGVVDRRADVYAIGVMLWEAAAGRRLWQGMSDIEILGKLSKEDAPRVSSVRPDVSPVLDEICARAMRQKSDGRYASAVELRKDLEAHLATRSDAPSMRDIGAAVAEVFAEERRQISSVIETTLAKIRSGPISGSMPILEVASGAGTRSGSGLRDDSVGHTSLPAMAASLPAIPSPGMRSGHSEFTAHSGIDVADDMVPPWRRAMASGAAKRAFIGITALVCLSAVAVAVSSSGSRSASAAHVGPQLQAVDAPSATTTAVAAAALAGAVSMPSRKESDLVELAVRVTPAGAQISIDGAGVASNPFHGRYVKDGQMHHLLATADGYESKLMDVSFSGDVSVEVSLDRKVNPGATHRYQGPTAPAARPVRNPYGEPPAASALAPSPALPSATPPSPPAVKVDVDPAGGRAPMHPILTNNPYGAQ